MKVRKIYRRFQEDYEEDLDEEFTSQASRDSHWEKHQDQFKQDKVFARMTPEEYEERAEVLQAMPVDNKNIFGYYGEHKDKDGNMRNAYYKYNKQTQEYVVYVYFSNGEPRTVTYYRIPWSQYNGDKALQYLDEIEDGK